MARRLVVEIVGDASSLEKSYATATRSTKAFTRDISHATRGALAGTGAMRGFGRSLAFASGGFLAFGSASKFLTDSVNAAREAGVAQRSLAAQMKAAGESFAANRGQVEKASLSYEKFGFQNDEVIQSLTVLERGTGNINQAIRLQGLTADIARAKNIDLAAAANTVAKVFGGQETALRRAVPGLAKHAHGWDLIRLAQAKMAGQAAANTTTSEQFAATLHDTEEIIGTALLPTLNKYLTSLGQWLQKMNESGKLQKDVTAAVKVFTETINAAKAVLGPVVTLFKALSSAVGGTSHALEVLAGVWAGSKLLGAAGALQADAAAVGAIGTAAEGAAARVGGLRSALILARGTLIGPVGLIAAAGAAFLYMQQKAQETATKVRQDLGRTFTHGARLETALIPDLANQIRRLKAQGETGAQIIAALRKRLGGRTGTSADLIAEAFAFQSGADPKLRARIRRQVDDLAGTAQKAVDDETRKFRATPAQRNTWFDALISRRLGRVQDITSLGGQLGRLREIAAMITKRIRVTRDITRKLNLEDQLLQVIAQQKAVREQLAQQATDALALNIQRAGLTATMADDIAALNAVIANLEHRIQLERDIGKKLELESQLIGYQQQRIDTRRQAAEQARQAAAARQFRALGFGPGGEDLVPGLSALRKHLAAVTDAIQGTFLNTQKTRSMLAHIRQVLSGGLGAIGNDVRSKIAEMLNAIDEQLKQHGRDRTRFSHVNAASFLAQLGLGLTPAQARRLQSALSQVGAGGSVPAGRPLAFAGVTVHGDVHIHGVQNTKQLEAEIHRRAKGRAHTRRGAQ